MLATSIVSRDDSVESGSSAKEGSTIHNLIQKDRVLSAVRLGIVNFVLCHLIFCTFQKTISLFACVSVAIRAFW